MHKVKHTHTHISTDSCTSWLRFFETRMPLLMLPERQSVGVRRRHLQRRQLRRRRHSGGEPARQSGKPDQDDEQSEDEPLDSEEEGVIRAVGHGREHSGGSSADSCVTLEDGRAGGRAAKGKHREEGREGRVGLFGERLA